MLFKVRLFTFNQIDVPPWREEYRNGGLQANQYDKHVNLHFSVQSLVFCMIKSPIMERRQSVEAVYDASDSIESPLLVICIYSHFKGWETETYTLFPCNIETNFIIRPAFRKPTLPKRFED